MEVKDLYYRKLETHNDLAAACRFMRDIGTSQFAGNEEFVDTMKSVGESALSVASWVGGKALNLLDTGVKKVSVEIRKAFDDNKMLSNKISGALKEEHYDFSFSSSIMGNLTSTGKFSDFSHDLDTLIRTIEGLVAHMKAVNDHLGQQLTTARRLKSADSTSSIVSVVKAFETITYPDYKLAKSNNGWAISDVLPGGKVIKSKREGNSVVYSMSGDKPAGESHDWSASKSEIKTILDKINKLNDAHQKVQESYAGYLDFVKAWAEVVKEASAGLDKTKNVGSSVINEAESILKGDATALAFYSGFCPRAVNYLDGYIQNVLGVFVKVI